MDRCGFSTGPCSTLLATRCFGSGLGSGCPPQQRCGTTQPLRSSPSVKDKEQKLSGNYFYMDQAESNKKKPKKPEEVPEEDDAPAPKPKPEAKKDKEKKKKGRGDD